jgi:cytidylate kinase
MTGTANIIAIDGPASSGKSTIARQLADELDYLYFDTGVMYRAVTLAAQWRQLPVENEQAMVELARQVQIDVYPPSQPDGRSYDVYLDGSDVTWDIRRAEVEAQVSVVSAYAGVRQALSVQQRRIGLRGRVVMVGRDIGTVVLPEADLKIYLDASIEERARRRYAELQARHLSVDQAAVLEALRKRDLIDSTRDVAPLRPAADAVLINTDGLSIEQVLERIKALL